MRWGWKIAWLVPVLLAGGGNLAFADLAATVDPSKITSTDFGTEQSLGWRFFVDQAITITSLGLYDAGDNGLATGHVMGIWRVKKAGGLQLEQWVNVSGTGDVQHYVFATLADPFTILPDPVPYVAPDGKKYYERWLVGVWSPTSGPSGSPDPLILHPENAVTLAAEQAGIISLEDYTWKTWTIDPVKTLGDVGDWHYNWVPWGDTYTGDGHFGVNFQYTLAPVPVPGAVLLGILGLSCAGWRLRRKTT